VRTRLARQESAAGQDRFDADDRKAGEGAALERVDHALPDALHIVPGPAADAALKLKAGVPGKGLEPDLNLRILSRARQSAASGACS
jgi:hypothetical protein